METRPPLVVRHAAGGISVWMGWGRLLFAPTFADEARLARALAEEGDGERDIAFRVRDPHVLLAHAPDQLFLDPSHTYRLERADHRAAAADAGTALVIDEARAGDGVAVDRVLSRCGMVTCDEVDLLRDPAAPPVRVVYVARLGDDVVGTVTAVDHALAFDDPERGSSLWCLAVDPECAVGGVGEALVRHLVAAQFARGSAWVELSVMHDNEPAIRLYRKLGFRRVHEFTVKRRNPINEPLFVPAAPDAEMNPYAAIIVDEARRRGIAIDVLDAELPLFELRFGGRTVRCRESLSDLTSAVALQLCDDKRRTRRVFERAGLRTPAQRVADHGAGDRAFLERHGEVVVKPARGEQGVGISVGVRGVAELAAALSRARAVDPEVLVEQFVRGVDLRIVVIGDEVVAAAVRRPPVVVGDGRRTIRALIERLDRRRAAATGGESRVPVDAETERTVVAAGHTLGAVLARGETLAVRRTANVHTGGTIHDVTDELSPELGAVGLRAARALDIPVVGLDLIAPAIDGTDYWLIEANERPGLANHEPRPTAERFVDLLFPQTARRGMPGVEGR